MRVLSLVLFILSLPVFANAAPVCDDLSQDVARGIWSVPQSQANDTRKAICDYVARPIALNHMAMQTEVADLVAAVQKALSGAQSPVPAGELRSRVSAWLTQLSTERSGYGYPNVSDMTSSGNGIDLTITPMLPHANRATSDTIITFTLPQQKIETCNCFTAINDLGTMLRNVYYAVPKANTVNIDKMAAINASWTSYLDDARAQTYLDIGATTLINRWFDDANQGVDFDLPPDIQWFALRPNIVIENVAAAVDGQKVQEGLALELLGFNLWQENSCLGLFACGFSATLNYADRGEVESTGWGLMMHIENSYSIGVVKYGGDVGVYVTVDILKLFDDEQSTYARYMASRQD